MTKQEKSNSMQSVELQNEVPRRVETASVVINTDAAGAGQEHRDATGTSEFLEVEPWREVVNGDALAEEVFNTVKSHTVMSEPEQLTVALWAIYAHVYDLWRHSPFLGFQSPVMRCGKTTALGVVAAMVPKPMPVAHVTGPGIFRMIDEHSPTVLIDELDQIINRNRDLHSVLNASHNRDTAYVPRVVGGKPVRYRVFGPKVLASIGTLPATIQDRALVINLRRKRPEDVVASLPNDPAAYTDLRRRIARWVLDHREALGLLQPAIPAGLNDRAADNWRPLLAIAELLGPYWAALAKTSAMEVSRAADVESVDPAEQLLRDIAGVFKASSKAKQLPVSKLHAALVKNETGLWADGDQALSKSKLARMLVPFGIRSKVVRVGRKVQRVYQLEAFKDAFSRYCTNQA